MSPSDQQYEIVCKLCGTHNEQAAVFCANSSCGAFLEWEGEVVGPANAAPVPDATPGARSIWSTKHRRRLARKRPSPSVRVRHQPV